MSGVTYDPHNFPQCFTAGLPAICAVWMSLIRLGGGDIVMASTSYGGSSELTDLLVNRTGCMRKTTFDITGTNPLVPAIEIALKKIASEPEKLKSRVMVFVEIPTNPDMKVPDVKQIAEVLLRFKADMKVKAP
jgi:cystathionine beta-lyase/cystathionine gamma-synthase